MAILQTNIASETLPVDMDDPNALRVFYKTNLLFPAAGPVASARAVARATRVLSHLVGATLLLEAKQEYNERVGELRVAPVNDPASAIGNGLRPYSIDFTKRVDRQLRRMEASTTDATDRPTGRPRSHEPRPRDITNNLEDVPPGDLQIAESRALLRGLAIPNVVMHGLFDAGSLTAGPTGIVEAELPTNMSTNVAVVTTLARAHPRNLSIEETELLERVIVPALDIVDRATGSELRKEHDSDDNFRDNLNQWLTFEFDGGTDRVQGSDVAVDPGSVDTPFSSEWALQRHEELQLTFGRPVFRGPVSASATAPKTERTITETATEAILETRGARRADAVSTLRSRTVVSSARFQSALDNLSEFGISEADSFSSDATLLTTLNEERRAVVDTVTRELTRENETTSSFEKVVSSGRSEQYRSEGKDPKLATTEIGYQVVAPVAASVVLRDVSLVWCPRIISPFLKLHGMIDEYERQEKKSYLSQHYVPLPVKPVISTTVFEEVFEIAIKGDDPINTKLFTREFEFTGNSFIDLDGIRAKHRNGTWDDYNWDERGNWDDLENASARVQDLTLSADGRTLSGKAVLETTDPEYFNKGFITIVVPIRTYNEETVAALEAHEQALLDQTFKEAAVHSRAAQFAALKTQELIERYEDILPLRKEAYRNLIRAVFVHAPPTRVSFFEEVISRCVNWSESVITFDSQPMDQLVFPEFAPDHFMNCPSIRFFLPIHESAEDLFFATLEDTGLTYHVRGATQARDAVDANRARVRDLRQNDPASLVLDQFDTEVVLGQHAEAVLSRFEFSAD